MNLLQKGDVILTADHTLLSKGVRYPTLGRFSHATIYVGDGSYIHSDGKGVHADNIQRLLFKSKKHVAVLRPKQQKYVESACIFSRTQVGKEYSVKEAIRTIKNALITKEINRQFCSRLVAQAYSEAGIKISSNIDYCTPKKIHKSDKFFEVKKCIRIASNPEINFANSYNPLEDQKQIFNDILKFARKITSLDIQTFDQLVNILFSKPQFDYEISNFMKKVGYFDIWRYEYAINRWRYDYESLVEANFSEFQKLESCKNEIEKGKNILRTYENNLLHSKMSFYKTRLKYIEMQIELLENLIRITKEKISVCSKYLENKT